MKKSKTAFATFDGAAARAFIYERANGRLKALPGFPMNGEKKPDFEHKRGRIFKSYSDARSAAEPHSDPEKLLERDFVSEVADRLESLRAEQAFDTLIVSAGPRALGYWREVAPKELCSAVKKEIPSDHVNSDDDTLLPVVENAFFG